MAIDLKGMRSPIWKPLNEDGTVGFDAFDKFVVLTQRDDEESVVMAYVHDIRGMNCAVCGRGWEMDPKSVLDQEVWLLTESIVHRSCLARHNGLIERRDYQYALLSARLDFKSLVPVANEYHPSSIKPWYHADLRHHPVRIVIGRRKRVDSIQFLALEGSPDFTWLVAAEEIFKDEKVTKRFSARDVVVHAWTEEKTRVYLCWLAIVSGFNSRRPGAV